jgi:hypothetical protein
MVHGRRCRFGGACLDQGEKEDELVVAVRRPVDDLPQAFCDGLDGRDHGAFVRSRARCVKCVVGTG